MTEPLLSVRDLSVAFHHGQATTLAVDRVSFDILPGEVLALVGESGSGKSVTANSILRLLPYPTASHPSGEILFARQDLLKASDQKLLQVRGNDITMIFQEPMTSLNPVLTIGFQIMEPLTIHLGMSDEAARKRAIELLQMVGIPDAPRRLDQ
ncbi:MAG TPA: ATP-binding cassette domain-containing protein, partial [Pseudorhizobium sp.]|nr:ATP-binding cassette domain-containing protein [Pseudorhizobium sp.]